MKKLFTSLAILLLAGVSATAWGVTLRMIDARGKTLANMPFTFWGKQHTTNAQGEMNVEIERPGEQTITWTGPWYNQFVFPFTWDGQAEAVTVQTHGYYYATLRLTGLTDDEAAHLEDTRIELTSIQSATGSTPEQRVWSGSVVWGTKAEMQTFVGAANRLEYIVNYNDWYGRAEGVADLTQEVTEINLIAGKRKLVLLPALAHEALPIEQCQWDGIRLEGAEAQKPVAVYRQPEAWQVVYRAPGYLPATLEYDLTSGSDTLQADYSKARALRIKATDRDGTPLVGARIWCDSYDMGQTDAQGANTLYALPDESYQIRLTPAQSGYYTQERTIRPGEADVTLDLSYEGARRVQVRLAHVPTYANIYGSIVSPGQSPEVSIVLEGGTIDEATGDRVYTAMIDAECAQRTDLKLRFDIEGGDYGTYLPIEEPLADLSQDMQLAYDLGTWRPARLTIPQGTRMHNDETAIDGITLNTYRLLSGAVLMPQGRHEWTPVLEENNNGAIYANLPARAFELGADSVVVDVAYEIPANLPGVKLHVTGLDGQPAKGFKIYLREIAPEQDGAYTTARLTSDSTGTVGLHMPAGRHYSITTMDAASLCKPQELRLSTTNQLEHKTVSFADYHALTFRTQGITLSDNNSIELEWCATPNMSEDSIDYDDYDSYYSWGSNRLMPEADADAPSWSCTLYAPTGYISARARVRDEQERQASLSIEQLHATKAQVIPLDFSAYQPVTFITPDEDRALLTIGRLDEQGRPIEDDNWLGDDELFPQGSYYAYIYNDYYQNVYLPFGPTVHFKVENEPVEVRIERNSADYRTLRVNITGAPFQPQYYTLDLFYNQIQDDLYYHPGDAALWAKGRFDYLIDELYEVHSDDDEDSAWGIIKRGSFEVGDATTEVTIDLSDLRFFTVVDVRDESGRSLLEGEHSNLYIYDANDIETDGGDRMQLGLPDGSYLANIGVWDESAEFGYTEYYCRLDITPQTPSEVILTMSTDLPTGISATCTSGLRTRATTGGLLIEGKADGDVRVEVIDMAGRRVMTTTARPGATIPTAPLAGGIYIVRLTQGQTHYSMKFMR